MELLLIAIGLFAIIGAILNLNWFVEHNQVRPFYNMVGRNGVRAMYVAMGSVTSFAGALGF